MSLPEGILFGMGNPLLDISVTVDSKFLEEYGMKPNDAILAEDKHVPMYHQLVQNYDVEYIAGGSVQNTLRVAQWVLEQPKVTTFMGAVGTDKFSTILEQGATSDGVNVRYQKWPEHPTGTCAVLLTGHDRSLCAYLAAANHFTEEHLKSPDNFAFLTKAQYIYISGFFLTVSPESIMTVAKHAAENKKPFMMNLSAPFIPQFFTDRLLAALPYVDILFGNETEAETFAKVQNFGTTDIVEIAKKVAALPKETDTPRTVIFTQGKGNVIVVREGKVQEFPVVVLSPEQIKDTNGAGDAFVGGFLAQYIQGKSMEECIKCGIWTATEIIQRSGCTFPKDKKYGA